jgi:tight adherence protein C
MMDAGSFLGTYGFLGSPVLFSLLIAAAAVCVWLSLAPARPVRQVKERLDCYVEREDVLDSPDMRRSFGSRVIMPALHRVLHGLGRLAPQKNMTAVQQMLVRAGEPGGLTALDFVGVRLLAGALLGGGYLLLAGFGTAPSKALLYCAFLAVLGYLLPGMWMKSRMQARQNAITRALPDALDMLTIGVEAGLAFESALLRVGEKWDNALTREFRRAVGEMRVGTSRETALQRMADRCGVQDLSTFVAVLVQSSQLGVSIAQVLHTQADEMRIKRRQRAEELARQASIKITFPLVFLIFPAMFVVVLGPAVPRLMETLRAMSSGSGRTPL